MAKRTISTRLAVDGEKEFKKALDDIGRNMRVLGSEMQKVTAEYGKNDQSIDGLTAKNRVLSQQVEQQEEMVRALSQAVADAADAYGENDKKTDSYRIQLNRAEAALASMQRELSENESALNEARSSTNKEEDAVDELSSALGESVRSHQEAGAAAEDAGEKADGAGISWEGLGSVVSGSVKTIGAAAAGVATAVGGAIGYSIDFYDEYRGALNDFYASTGAANDELSNYENIMKSIYANNYGESFDDIGEAMSTIRQQIGPVVDAWDDTDLQEFTESAFVLRDSFGYDMPESIRAVNTMMEQFSMDGQDAMDLIASGAQNGLDYSGELLDSINEYSVQFSKVGLDADDMFQIFQNGADSGAFNLDKVGDAVKELSVKVVDGSETTKAGFEAIGLNADEMAKKFAAGGESAREAFIETNKALADIDDPLAQSTAGVNLYGTMWEDLGPDVVTQLADITDAVYGTEDAMNELKEIKYDDFGSAIQGVGRQLQTEFLVPLSENMLPIFDELSNGLQDAGGDFEKIGEVVGTAGGKIAAEVSKMLPQLIQAGGNILKGLVSGIGANMSSITTAISQVIPEIVSVIVQMLPQLIPAAMQIISALGQALLDNLPQIIDAGIQLLMAIINGIIEALPQLIDAAIQVIMALANGLVDALPQLIPALVDAVLYIVETLIDNVDMLIDAAIEIIMALAQGLINSIPRLIERLPEIIDKLVNALINNSWKLLEAGLQIILALAQALVDNVPRLIDKIPQILMSLVNGFAQQVSRVWEIGRGIVEGIWDGIKNAAGWLWDQITGWFGGIIDGAKDFLGIHSPSTVFAEMGRYMAQGIGVGFDGEMDDVSRQMQRAIPTSFDTRPNISAGYAGGYGTTLRGIPALAGTDKISMTTVINYPKYGTPAETARLTRNAQRATIQSLLVGSR
ncbi:phage tail tape measure protein [Solibaculum mannosilyticum]|uniref:Phage tail tape measure protein domain-containing protein n=1 Tax=Solibaculum mannosilyticum TaxID=2780922 RepID=A0A7I8D1Z7_9FIRM|nr:phage tail tape measure protein [Solibaculum mannosilyticum]BCI60851.1 hypothetical protein C12CBH8_14900 [Solibaculum mannosilyticum]